MKVLIIPSWYPEGEDKLMGVYHKEYAEALAESGVQTDMLYVYRQGLRHPLKYLFMKKYEVEKENGYNVYKIKMLNLEPISFKLHTYIYTKKLEKLYKKYIKSESKPDILHAEVILPAGYATTKLGTKYNIPVVITEHATYYEEFFEGKNLKYTEYALKHSYFTAVSEYMLKGLPDYVTKKAVIPNLVDTDSFKLNRKKIKGLRIAKVCAFRKGKRVEQLLEALKIIVDEKRVNDVKMTVVGDGYLEGFYKSKCHELGLDDYVDFVGRKTKKEIAEILNECNMFVIPTRIETFCIPGIEALASGMPVVTTKCKGPEEYVDDKCGMQVEVGDIRGMADAICEVYKNIDKYDVNYLRQVADRYSKKSVIDNAKKIYDELLRK